MSHPPDHSSTPDQRPIVLTGFMGTGKTTVGRIVAERLGFGFVDTDQLITQRHGPIAAIFTEQGENAFRAIEREVTRELADQRRVVIATGGRLMLDPANAAALSCSGLVVCLVAPAEQIVARVLADGSGIERPLLAGPDPAARVATLLDERRAGYGRFAQIDTDGLTAEQVADKLIELTRSAPTKPRRADDPPYTGGLLQTVRRIDDAVDGAFDQLRGRRGADFICYAASEAADFSVAWHLISAGIAVVSPSRRRHAVRLAVTLGIESVLVNGVLKQFVKRERPPLLEDRAYAVRRPSTRSFPSGHASSATVAASLLSDAVPALAPVWATLGVTVAASRVHNRMHHASDVAAGAVVGAAIGFAAKRLWPLSR